MLEPATRRRSLLRIATAGSVDDGKSTLIGRLLHDTKTLLEDQLGALERASARRGQGVTDLALVTDGLRAEREQGITIDVAYRFFSTPARSFILADTPGHAQYTRNMVTGASTADVAVVLVDVRHGVVEQTRRHVYVAALLGVGALVVAVNKMDLVGWDEHVFEAVAGEVAAYVAGLPFPVPVRAVPVSALHGDNVVELSARMPWYEGPSLLAVLEAIDVGRDRDHGGVGARLPVQWVIRPPDHPDRRGYAGQLAGGVLAPGDAVVVLPAGIPTTVVAVETADGPLHRAMPGQAVTVRLADHVDVGRGDTVAAVGPGVRLPLVGTEVEADVCWMAESPLWPRSRHLVKHTTRTVRALVSDLVHRIDVDALVPRAAPARLDLNDLGRVRLRVATPIVADPYEVSRVTGRFVVVDEASNATAAAGMIRSVR
ncbi:MAG: GTP-binding protein [Acidimicrobiia bacterium]|nr:GTP-binding protein [Acidimicrobiia bacterium]